MFPLLVDGAMRAAELINFVFFTFLIALAWLRPLATDRRIKATALGVAAIILVSGAQFIGRLLGPLPTSIIRDWLPAPLLLVAYWTAGLFFAGPDEKFQSRLIRFDRKVLGRLQECQGDTGTLRGIAAYFELAYLLCYPLLPFGLGVLYMARMGRYADEFWRVVLPSAYLCYTALPFAQTLPPRMLPTGSESILPPAKLRTFNLWILHWGSIHINTFPSAHVATAFSVSLVLLRLLPQAGIAFLWIAISIAIGAVLGRYHYMADVIVGAALAITIFLLEAVL